MDNKKNNGNITLTAKADGKLLETLYALLPSKPQGKLKALLKYRCISVDGFTTSQFDYPVKAGSEIIISTGEKQSTAQKLPLDIIYEDETLIAVNKPSGLLTISTEKEKEQTAYHIVMEYVRRKNKNARIFIVHRLDKETSGVVLFAKTEEMKRALMDNWDSLVKTRGYIAVAEGKMASPEGHLVHWLKETKTHLVYASNSGNGKKAITNYKVLREKSGYSILEILLETGRKNQIRVQLQAIGHPVTGDKKYGAMYNPLKRLALHANILELTNPLTKEEMRFEAKVSGKLEEFVSK